MLRWALATFVKGMNILLRKNLLPIRAHACKYDPHRNMI